MGNGMNKVLPGLYLGNFIDAKDLEQLSRNKITHIISIHESPQPLLQEMTYLRIPLPDTPEANIKKHFKECISFIHYCRLHGGNCLVHCLAGISRSTTIVVAYVMAVTELSWQEVLQAVRAVRPIANPNPGFKQQLEEFGHGPARKIHRHLEQRYGADTFNDEEEIRLLLPADREGTDGPLQGLVPRSRDIKNTVPFLLRVKQTFSCIPTCLKCFAEQIKRQNLCLEELTQPTAPVPQGASPTRTSAFAESSMDIRGDNAGTGLCLHRARDQSLTSFQLFWTLKLIN
ncbi:dual specificity protein phosphatase 15 isoform X3 [Trachemys scripta elegans]|nr:dual specificity protein phosphatase 15 isoform X3 [Trachemys scripta elegans]